MLPRRRPFILSGIEVVASERITPNLQRLEFFGETISSFPVDIAGGYLKLAFDGDGRAYDPTLQSVHDEVQLRTYTIRHLDTSACRMSVDFVLHGDGSPAQGPASAFARNARIGDRIGVTGPGRVKPLAVDVDACVLASDLAGLPALSAVLENRLLSCTGLSGLLVIELLDSRDADYLSVPDSLTLHTVVNPDPTRDPDALVRTLRQLAWPEGSVFAWCAAEFARMRGFRTLVRDEHGIERDRRYVSSYWMVGRNEAGHRVRKQRDARTDRWRGLLSGHR